jgi:hypothetical protein
MNTEQINSIIDVPVVAKQFEVVMGGLKDIDAAIKSIKPLADIYKSANSTAELKKANEDLINGNGKLQKSQSELSTALKEYEKLVNQNAQAQAKMSAGNSNAAKELAATRIAQSEMNKELKNSSIVSQAAQGSLEQMRAQLALLTSQYDKMGAAQRNSPAGNALQQQIKGQVEALKQLEAETGRYQRNVGNYTGAIGILEKALQDVKQKIDDLTKTGQTNGEQFQKYAQEQSLLEQVLSKNTQGFASLTMEIRANERALATMFEQGMQDTEAYKGLQKQVSNASREVAEFKEQQKLLSSQTPGLSAMVTVVKGLGGAYAVGAGASALFANGNEKVEKELNKLVAIMTVLQGLNELHELIEKKGIIAVIARTAAEKLKNFVMTGSTQGIVQNTVANEANTVATEAGTVATKAMGFAMVGLRTALIATGIGALLVLLPTIANAMSSAGDKTETFKKRMEQLKETNPEVAESLDALGKTAEEVADNLLSKLNSETEDLRKSLGQIPDQVQIVNASLNQLGQRESELFKEMIQRKVSEDQNIWMRWFGRTSKDVEKDMEELANKAEQIRARMRLQATVHLEELMVQHKNTGVKEIEFNQQVAVAKAKIAGKTEKEIFDIEQQYADARIKLLENIASQFSTNDSKRIELMSQLTDEKNKKELAQLNFLADQKKKVNGGSKDASEAERKLNESIQKELDARFEIYKIGAQKKIDLDKQIAENDKVSEGMRLLATNAALKEEQDLIQQETQRKIQKIEQDTQSQLKTEKLTHKQRVQLAKTAQAEIDLAVTEGYELQVKAAEDAQKRIDAIQKKVDFESGMAGKLDKKPITSSLFSEISGKVALQTQKEKDRKEEQDAELKRLDTYKNYALKATELATTLFNRAHELRLNQIQAEIDANAKLRGQEIDRITNSTLSEQDKAAKIAQVQASAQAKEDQLNKKKRDEQVKEARFNKAKSLIDVAINTAVAVSKDLIANKAMIPFDIIMGAAEAAIIMAQPIPKYAEGTGHHPGGSFIWGEAGRELAILPGGKTFLSPDEATLSTAPKGTQIIPHDELNQALFAIMMRNTTAALERQPNQIVLEKKIDQLNQTVVWQTQELKKAYGKQKQKTINNIRVDTNWGNYIQKKVFE